MKEQNLNISRFTAMVDGYVNGLGSESFDFAMLLVDWKNRSMQTLTRMESGPFGSAADLNSRIAYHKAFIQLLTEADPDNPEGVGAAFTKALTEIMVQTCASDPEFHKNFEYLVARQIGESVRCETERQTINTNANGEYREAAGGETSVEETAA